MKKIGMIGSGVVGSTTGIGLKILGNEVIFFDINQRLINDLIKRDLNATTDLEYTVKNSDIFFFSVPTPDKDGKIDLNIMESAIKEFSKLCNNKNEYFLVVIKSTVIPTTVEKVIIPLIEKYSNKKVGMDFGICFNPEFLRDKYALEDFINPDRIVIGEYDKKSGDLLAELYASFKCPIIRTDMITAEMTKYANNCFYATKISFFNEMHMMCQKIGADSNTIRKVVQLDKFYGTHPWEHGHSFGGKCLPKDLNAIIYMFNEEHIHDPVLLKAVRKINIDINNKTEKSYQ